ncbi:family 16 glycosylhydrolase [Flammeovirga agarivorans]|uniref:Family 16 glycosylhydrolase n=1 Tax=Flammeovirga agarivorans TaxID=2726742 RepID=A0A7X8XXL3_9BACT|nr:family 16 glycosylhydrolase [Flammeovirga agarivorans]NLR93347.1 family 16 glycosylhydrolase [Flammeovirga agarivorans]
MKTYILQFVILLNLTYAVSAQNLTIPPKNYVDTVDIAMSVNRSSDKLPLSDQGNSGEWKLLKKFSDEFDKDKINEKRWYPNNPKWKGRQPTYFHGSNVSIENGEAVFRVNKHGNEKLPEGYTHTSGFIKSKNKFLYGYFEAEMKLMNAPWVSGFWMTNVSKDWWTEIDICENAPGLSYNRNDLNSNIHVFRAPEDQGNVKEHFSRTKKFYIPLELQDDYHVWGLEWTEEYIRFYIDGVLFREAKNTHWHQPLEVNFNNESNKWFGAIPDDNRLDGEFHVKYFRVWESKSTSKAK